MVAKKGLITRKHPNFISEGFRQSAIHAAQVYAQWDSSDPNAYNRMIRDIDRGFAVPSEVVEEFLPKVNARRQEIINRAEQFLANARNI